MQPTWQVGCNLGGLYMGGTLCGGHLRDGGDFGNGRNVKKCYLKMLFGNVKTCVKFP